jgi:hypothetical protein
MHGAAAANDLSRFGDNGHLWLSALAIYHQLRRAFVWVNNSWASSVRFGRFSSTCRLEETESLADSRRLMLVARILIALCSHAMKPLPEALSLPFLEHKMGRVFRSLAFGYGKPQRMKVQTMEQRLSLTKKNGCRHDVERVDQAGS